MNIAVASGKGGTGKTTVSAALVSAWDSPVAAVDLDVEEPNLHLFLHPELTEQRPARMLVPVVDESRCDYCRACAEICQFKAISVLGRAILTFSEMCHGCGGCLMVCPHQALQPGSRLLGEVLWGRSGPAHFIMGRLRVGEAMSPPLIREVKARLEELQRERPMDAIVDAPPGVSCPAVNAAMDCDVVLLVTEPTPFGLYDLKLAVEAFGRLGRPMGVVINRAGLGDDGVQRYCRQQKLPVLAQIPYQRSIAEAYSRGQVVSAGDNRLGRQFRQLADDLRRMADGRGSAAEVQHG